MDYIPISMRSIRALTLSLWVKYVNYQYNDACDIKRFGTSKNSPEKNSGSIVQIHL